MVTAERGADPKNTFLTTPEVMKRYRWCRTRAYEYTGPRRREGFPPRIGGAFRLDTLIAWEQRRLAKQGWPEVQSTGEPAIAVLANASPAFPAKRQAGRRRSEAE